MTRQLKLAATKEKEQGEGHSPETFELLLEWWSRPAESGERLLTALRAYHEVFVAEEENRIRPALQLALEQAQERASRIAVLDLLEELSQGVRLDEGFEASELVLAPSFWGAPPIIFGKVAKNRDIILFGARPQEASLVPGEVVPDMLLRLLKLTAAQVTREPGLVRRAPPPLRPAAA